MTLSLERRMAVAKQQRDARSMLFNIEKQIQYLQYLEPLRDTSRR